MAHTVKNLPAMQETWGHLMGRANSLEKTLMLGKIESREGDDKGWDGWMASLTQWTWAWASSGRWWRTGRPGVLQSMQSQRVGHDWATEQQQQVPVDFSNTTHHCSRKIWQIIHRSLPCYTAPHLMSYLSKVPMMITTLSLGSHTCFCWRILQTRNLLYTCHFFP